MFRKLKRACMQVALKRFGQQEEIAIPQQELAARYEVRPRFLSPLELEVYRLLIEAVEDRAIVCPKPRVFEALRVLDAALHLEDALRIDRKHIDFLLCDPHSGRPLGAVQIDVWDEHLQGYRLREALLEEAFRRARFPVAYLLSDQLPTAEQLWQTIEELCFAEDPSLSDQSHFAHLPLATPMHQRSGAARSRQREWQINP